MLPMRAFAFRISWSILDQALSSITNAALSFLVARSVSQSLFGSFAVAFTVYSFVVGISRALVSQPLTLRFSGASVAQFRAAVQQVVSAAAWLGMAAGATVALCGLLIGGQIRAPFLGLAVTLPGLLVQDAWRLAFFAQARPERAALNDLVWTGAQVCSVSFILVIGWRNPAAFIGAWGLAGMLAAGFGLLQFRLRATLTGSWSWLRGHLGLTLYSAAQFVGISGAFQGAVLLLAAVAGVEQIASLRGAQVLLGPLNIVIAGVCATILPEILRRRLDWHGRGVAAVTLSLAMSLVPLIWTGLLLLMPSGWGQALLGDTWLGSRAVLLASGVGYAAVGAALGPELFLLALQRTREVFWLTVALAGPLFAFGVIGMLLGDAPGAAVGFAAAQWLVVPLWWIRFRILARRGAEPPTGPPTTTPARSPKAAVESMPT